VHRLHLIALLRQKSECFPMVHDYGEDVNIYHEAALINPGLPLNLWV
jgi:hypothetical protein